LVSFAACGTTDESDSTSSSSSSNSSGTTKFDVSNVKKDAKLAAEVPSAISKDGTLTIGSDTSYAPSEFLKSDGKTPQGFSIDLSKAIAATLGLKLDTQTASFDSIIPSVGSKYEMGVSSFTITAERMKAVSFVSYFDSGMTYVVKKGNPKKMSISNLCGTTVAAQTGTVEFDSITATSAKCVAAGKKKIDVLSYDLQTDVTTAVISGKASISYADTPVAGYAIQQTGDQLQTLGADQDVAKEGFAISKSDTKLATAVKDAVNKLIEDGTYKKILTGWGVESGAIEKAEINPTA
jgi:polar amino acid transport system substrate-binding protein